MKDPADELTPELDMEQLQRFVRTAQAVQRAVDELGAGKPKPRRVRKGGASRNAARSADKPERGER